MRKSFLLILVAVILGISGCTQFGRPNPCDPGSSNFRTSIVKGKVISKVTKVAVEGATVELSEPESKNTKTDKEGKFAFSGVEPCETYSITATKEGYSQETKGVTTDPGEVSEVDLELKDIEDPNITHDRVTGADFGIEVEIEAVVTDNEEDTEVKLFYRISTESDFTEALMEETSEDFYEGVIPSDFVVMEGVDYYIQADDASGNSDISGSNSKPHHIIVATESPMVTPTPTPSPSPTPTPTKNIIFEDNFDGSLKEGWVWLNEDPTHWSLTDVTGSLRIILQPNGIANPDDPNNLLVRDAPTGDYEISTLVRFTPTSNFQFAGLLIFQDFENAIQLGRAYSEIPNCEPCIGNGIYFDNSKDDLPTGSNYATKVTSETVAYLRLRREGTTYTGYYSEDGDNWITIGEGHTRNFESPRIGLIAAQANEAETNADFDYFIIEKLP